MTADASLQVHPHPTGPWLVVLGERRLAVTAAVGRRLQEGDASLVRALRGAPAARRARRGPWLRRALLPARLVGRLAQPLSPVTSWPILAALAVGGALAVWSTGGPASAVPPTAGARLAAVLLLVTGGIVHELGHAAALRRGGYPPGRIGVGVLAVLPVLWCDVSAACLLPRWDRVRVDLAGPALQLALAGVWAVLGRLAPGPLGAAAAAAGAWSLLVVAWSLTPFFRADGFWVATDLAGVDDLARGPRPDDRGRIVALLAAYRAAHTTFFGAIAAAALDRADPGSAAGCVAAAVGGGLILLLVLRLAAFLRALRRRFP